MTDTDQEDSDDSIELLPLLYVERSTNLIYECKFFDTFVLVRPATPVLYLAIKKLGHDEFMDTFDEFMGDPKKVREFINNSPPEFILN